MNRSPILRMVENDPFPWDRRDCRVAFISGLSNPFSCRLSALQQSWLASLNLPEEDKVYWNFPYVPDKMVSTVKLLNESVPIWKASIANYKHYRAMLDVRYQVAARKHFEAILNATDKRLFLIAISSGLEIVRVCELTRSSSCVQSEQAFAEDQRGSGRKVQIVALGPVSRGKPNLEYTTVGGDCDWISSWFFKSFDHHIPGVGHMDYLKSSRVTEIVENVLQS